MQESIRLAHLLAEHGVDVIDVSSGGNHPLQELSLVRDGEAYQSYLSAPIKAALQGKALVTTAGGIRSGVMAQEVLADKKADVIMVGRWFQRNPGLVWQFADDLGVTMNTALQIEWGFVGRGVGRRRQPWVTSKL